MSDNATEKIGLLGIASGLFGIASLFTGGLVSVFIALLATISGFAGTKKKQIFSQTGMIIGLISLLFFNLVSLGIIKPFLSQGTGKKHLSESIYRSIDAFNILKSGDLDEDDQKRVQHKKVAV